MAVEPIIIDGLFVRVGDLQMLPDEYKRLSRNRLLRRAELPQDTISLAKFLLGKTLVHDAPDGRVSGRIVETEAYPVGDSAGHAFGGETPSRRSLFLKRGHAYVYFTYGSSFMMNVSSETPGVGAGVLIRAVEPIEGVELMRRRRGVDLLQDLTRGPGRTAEAFAIDKRLDGVDLCAPGSLWLGSGSQIIVDIGESIRIGITRNVRKLYRFYECGNPFVSGPNHMRK